MANYNKNPFKMMDGKLDRQETDENEMINIKKGRAEKIFSYKIPTENTINNDKYENATLRRKELNEERIFTGKNSNPNDITNEDKMRENYVKNKMFMENKMKNKTYKDINNANKINSKNYYEPFNNNENNYEDYVNSSNHLVGENAIKNSKKNYLDRKTYEENIMMKDRQNFRRLEPYNENENLSENNAEDTMIYKDINMNANLQRNYNGYKKGMSNNKDILLQNTMAKSNKENFSKRPFKGNNYEYNEKGYKPYDVAYNQNNLTFLKSKEYNDYGGNDENMKYPKGNNRNTKMFRPKEINDPMTTTPIESSSVTTTAFAQRDLTYRRHAGNNEIHHPGGKENVKRDMLVKEKVLIEDGEETLVENDPKIEMRVLHNKSNEFQRGKGMPSKNMIGAPSSASTEMTMMGLNRKGAPVTIFQENVSDDRMKNPNMAMYKSPPLRPGGTLGVGGKDVYGKKYPPNVTDMNKGMYPNNAEKDGKRDPEKSGEYQNESLSTMDSNNSSANVFESLYPSSSNLLDTHVMPMRNDHVMVDGNVKSGEYNKEEKGTKDIGHKGMMVPRNCMYTEGYDYNYKRGATKRPFKMEETSKNLNSNEKIPGKKNRENIGIDEIESMGKKYEYANRMSRERLSPEFGNDRHINIHGGGSNLNDLGNKGVMCDGRGENNMMKGNMMMENHHRDYKKNMNRYGPYRSPSYEEKLLRKQVNVDNTKDLNYLNKNKMHYAKMSDDEYCKYQTSDSYDKKLTFQNVKDNPMKEKDYMRNERKDYYNNQGYRKMSYKYKGDRKEKNITRSGMLMEPHANRAKASYKSDKYMNNNNYNNYPSECYMTDEDVEETNGVIGHPYDYRKGPYADVDNSGSERKGSLTVVRLPAENKKQVKKKRKKILDSSSISIVDIYSTAVPLSDHADPYVIKALSKNEALEDSIYALIPKSVKEIVESDDITHVTLNSPTSLFVTPKSNVKQHILTSHYQDEENSSEFSPCVFPLSEDPLKDKSGGSDGEKGLKSIIRGASLRNKSGSSLSVKFKLVDEEREKKERKTIESDEETLDASKDLLKKIENYIPEEIKNLKIDKQTTEKKRASIFDESKEKSKNEKKKDFTNKIVLDSDKLKRATEIKLKRVQHVTGLFEKYGIPNPFKIPFMEKINFHYLVGLNEEAKLFNMALMVSNSYCKFIRKGLSMAEIKGVFNEKRKKMLLKFVELLGQQIGAEIKKKFEEVNVVTSNNKETDKGEITKHYMNAREREIKEDEHNIVCQYWEKQSECMNLLIKEWNKICEILESLNIDPNNIIGSLTSLYGGQVVMDYQLNANEMGAKGIELDIDLEDLTLPNMGVNENIKKFDPSNITITELIQDMQWDMELENSINQIRTEWINKNKESKKRVQKEIAEGIKHRVELIDYLDNVELNLNAFAKLIEGRIISKDDVKSQLMSMQDFQETGNLANILKKLKSENNEFLSESGKTPVSFFTTHHFPLTNSSGSENSNDNIKKEKKEKKEKVEIKFEGEDNTDASGKSGNPQKGENEDTDLQVENDDVNDEEADENDQNNNKS